MWVNGHFALVKNRFRIKVGVDLTDFYRDLRAIRPRGFAGRRN